LVVERIHGDGVNATLVRFRGEGRWAGGNIEHGLAAQNGRIEREEARVFLERAPEE